jgi:hypothetical protein
MTFEREGYEFCKGLIGRDTIRRIRAEMVDIMQPYCDQRVRGPDDLDEAFAQVTRRGGALRGNVLKLCSRLASLPLLLAEPGVRRKIDEIGMRTPAIQAYSILCMEPHVEKFLFEPHQDLKQRMSLRTIAFWVPLSGGPGVGGLGLAVGSHTKGPLRHGVSAGGQLVLPPDSYTGLPQRELTDYDEGDCLLFSPYLIHWSIPNAGECLRWTVSLKIDEVSAPAHLAESIHPFVIEDYVDTRSNEERIAEAARRAASFEVNKA